MALTACPHCASDVPQGFRFCGVCGQPLGAGELTVAVHPEERLITPLLGRDTELQQLVECLRTVDGGDSWIEVCGAPGIGKTRLLEEAGRHCLEKTFLTVTASAGTRHHPFSFVRQFVHRLLAEVTNQGALLQTREELSDVVGVLGAQMSSFVDVFWRLIAPSPFPGPRLDRHLSMFRWSLERGIVFLLAQVAEYKPDLGIFLDAYENADAASVAMLKSLSARSAAWVMPVVVASQDSPRTVLLPKLTIQLAPLAADNAEELLARFVRGADIPYVLRQEILSRAAGMPGRIKESVQILLDAQVLTLTPDATRWVCDPQASLQVLSDRGTIGVLDQLARPERELLNQCAVQGVEFDPNVMHAVQRVLHWHGPQVDMLLRKLERQGVLSRYGDPALSQWRFSSARFHQTCYESIPLHYRRMLHEKTANVLFDIAKAQEVNIPELLSNHYEHAEHWLQAATAHVQAGDRSAELFFNENALQNYQQAVEMVARLAAPSSDEATRLAIHAYGGATRLHFRLGALKRAEETAAQMRELARHVSERAEADRMTALAALRVGHVDEAERLLRTAISVAQEDGTAEDVLAQALADLTKLLCNTGRRDEALKYLQACHNVSTRLADASLVIRIDLLESDIAAAEGRFADATACCARAYEAARRDENLTELARAHNGLGIAARDIGDYEAAQQHFEQALTIWELSGEVEWIAGTYSNLGMLAQSRGDLTAAKGFYERALVVFRAMGSVDRVALVQANLANQALEEGDFRSAVTLADASLTALSRTGGNAHLRGGVLAVLGEGRLGCGDATGAQRVFDTILQDYEETHSPLVVAFAWRGCGRVALIRHTPADALTCLDRALQGFERLQRTQEAARTSFYRAVALHHMGEDRQAQIVLEHVHEQFVSIRMRAGRDAERAERLLRQLSTIQQDNRQ